MAPLLTARTYRSQVATFRKYFVPAPSAVQWQGNDTLFGEKRADWFACLMDTDHPAPTALWFGINDIGFSLTNDVDFAEIQPAIGASYNSMIAALYAAGGVSLCKVLT